MLLTEVTVGTSGDGCGSGGCTGTQLLSFPKRLRTTATGRGAEVSFPKAGHDVQQISDQGAQ